jgi:hypothetical protein
MQHQHSNSFIDHAIPGISQHTLLAYYQATVAKPMEKRYICKEKKRETNLIDVLIFKLSLWAKVAKKMGNVYTNHS